MSAHTLFFPVRLMHEDGHVWAFSGLADLAKHMQRRAPYAFWQAAIGPQFAVRDPSRAQELQHQTHPPARTISFTQHSFIVRNGAEIVAFSDIPWPHKKGVWWAHNRFGCFGTYPPYSYRTSPVPGTGAFHGSSRRRPPRTTQEKRHAQDVEHAPLVRATRTKRHLRSGYDMPYRKPQRSWKNHRAHQWRTDV